MKTFLFIDGTNLYAAQYELFGPEKYLDFPTFIKETEKKLKIKFNKIYFYASYTPRKEKITKKEQDFIKIAKKAKFMVLLSQQLLKKIN